MNAPEVIDLCSSSDDDDDEEEHIVCKESVIRSKKRPRTDEEGPFRKKQVHLHFNDTACVVTEGLMELLKTIPSVRCCAGDIASSLLHIQQKDKWSCGFRNLQMLLSFLLPSLKLNHSVSTGLEIPSVIELQHQMEAAWNEGFDKDGAQHYHHTIVGKTAWIGAVEVSSLLSYKGIDATVVQFIRCPESRERLVPFCVSYFRQSHPSVYVSSSSMEIVNKLLQDTSHDNILNTTKQKLQHTGSCDIPPLYLQWKGHSVCVVGFEVETNGTVHLLAFDPMKSGSLLTKSLKNNEVKPLRLDRAKLAKQDCQIVLCSTRALEETARERIKQCLQTATAAESAVLKAMAKCK